MNSYRRQLRVHQPEVLTLDEMPVPAPGPKDVLVRVAACGICGTDLGYLASGGLRGPGDHPMALGHEFSGIIESRGKEVDDLPPGMRIVVNPDDDAIGNGGSEGGFCNTVLIRNACRGRNIHFVPDNLNLELAALVEPLSVSLHGVNRARVKPGSKVVVYSAGMIGLGVLFNLRRRGVRDIVVVDRQEFRLDLARRLGARATINTARDDLRAELAKLHGESTKYGFASVNTDIFIDAAGAGELLQCTIEICGYGTRIVIVAVHRKPIPLDLLPVMAKEIELAGSIAYPDNEFQEILGMLAEREIDVTPLITHRFPLDEASTAFARARDADSAIKVMLTINA